MSEVNIWEGWPSLNLKTMEDQEILTANKDIPSEQVRKDIAETEAEILQMTQEADHLEKTPLSLPSARWDHMRASARRSAVADRQAFVEKLKKILKLRGENV